ncbi:MAG TPA: hypothetical protein VI386_22705 [Candidatus Sulfotelmatobacter sp.]
MADEINSSELFLSIQVSDQFMYEHEHLLMGLSYALAKSARSDRDLHDRDLLAALSEMCTSMQRLVNSGLHYEAPLASPSQQRVAAEVETMIKEFRAAEQKHRGYSDLRDSDALKALVFILRLGYSRTNGRPKSRAFVEFLYQQFPEQPAGLAPQDAGSRLIIP